MLRRFSLSAVLLVLCCCGTIAAQEAMVEFNDQNDPCSRFKMRIVMPADSNRYKFLVRKIEDETDYKMVWNPCPQGALQVTLAPPQPAPVVKGNIVGQRPSGFQFPTAKNPQKSGFVLPQRPWPSEVNRPQKQ